MPLATLFVTSSLAGKSLATEGFQQDSLSLTAKTLEKGYNLGLSDQYLELEDGTKLSVKASSYELPHFTSLPHYLQQGHRFTSYRDRDGKYHFNHVIGGGPGIRYNEETKNYDLDYGCISPGWNVFDLTVEVFSDRTTSENNSNKKEPTELLGSIIQEIPPIKIDTFPQISTKEETKVNNSSYRVLKEPIEITHKPQQSFYAEYNSTRNLHFRIERLTKHNLPRWRERLGWEALMQFGKSVAVEEFNRIYFGSNSQVNNEFSDTMNQLFGSSNNTSQLEFGITKEEFIRMKDGSNIIDEKDKKLYDQLYEASSENYKLEQDYLGAFRGFKYNLENDMNVPTYVAYVYESPGPIAEFEEMSVVSPHLKMAMTVQLSENFYSPLGIYKSPIANAYEKLTKKPCKQLSMLLHSFVARSMDEINPNAKHMMVKPLKSMESIFGKSGVVMSSSRNPQQNEENNLPYLKVNEKNLYELVDPRDKTSYEIPDYFHWFPKSPFLGGGNGLKFPVYTVDRKELGGL